MAPAQGQLHALAFSNAARVNWPDISLPACIGRSESLSGVRISSSRSMRLDGLLVRAVFSAWRRKDPLKREG